MRLVKTILSGASVFVWAFPCIILVLAFGANRSYGEASEIDIPFSDKDVRISFSADDWLDARELSFPSVIRGNNTVFLKYLTNSQELLVAFVAADTSPEGPDKLSIAIDTDKDSDRKLDANDYSFQFKRDGADEFFAVSNEDWYPQKYPGLHDSQESFSDRWLVIWRIPITLKENVPIGLMVTQLDQHDTISFPDAANDLDPGTWATMIPTKLTMTFHSGTLSRGETTTIMVRTFHSSPMDSITIQYQKANTTNEWKNLFSGSPHGDLIQTKWLPPAADEYRLRAIWNRSGIQAPIASTIKKLTVSKA